MSQIKIELPDQWQALRAAARSVRTIAYSPYSKYQVGAAIATVDGTIFAGCNVENASYGGTICAERSAVCSAVSAGQQEFLAICVSLSGIPVPCGICRQFLYEFNPDMIVLLDDVDADMPPECVKLSNLLPRAFRFSDD